MLKNFKKCSAMLILSALFSGSAVSAVNYLNLKTDSNQIHSSRGVLCEKCGHQHPQYFYVSGGIICGYICNGRKKDATFKNKPSTKGSYALHVSNEAPLVKLLKSFFNSSNWTTLENPDGTTIYTITPPDQDLTLTITFENEIGFNISCGRLNESFRISKSDEKSSESDKKLSASMDNKKTSASIIFKAFECFCKEKRKVSYFKSDTPEIYNYNPESTVGLNASLENINSESEETSNSQSQESEDFKAIDDSIFLESDSASTNKASSNFVVPPTPVSKRNRRDFEIPSTPIRKVTKKSRLTPSIHRNANGTPSQSLCAPTPRKNREHFLVTPGSERKRTHRTHITGVCCDYYGAVQRLKEYILNISHWHENPTPVPWINAPAQIQIPLNAPRGWVIDLREIFEAIPEFFEGKIPTEQRNLRFSSSTQPFYFKSTITYNYPLYCLTSDKLDADLMQRAYEYICYILDIQESPSNHLDF